MSYQVVWNPVAEQQLAEIWTKARDRYNVPRPQMPLIMRCTAHLSTWANLAQGEPVSPLVVPWVLSSMFTSNLSGW